MRSRILLTCLAVAANFAGSTPHADAKGGRKQVAAVRAAAERHCNSQACVAWIMRTVAAESCFKPGAINHNRRGGRIVSTDRGIAQVNSKNPPPWHRGSVWDVDASIRTMAEGFKRGAAARNRWVGSRKPIPAGCGY